jgi:hypothetical protein
MQAFLELVAERKVHLKPLITHRFPIEQAESAYALMMEGSTPYIAMVITYPSDRAHPLPRTIAVGTAQTARPVTLGIIGAGNHVRDMLLPPLQSMSNVGHSRHLYRLGSHRENPGRQNSPPPIAPATVSRF